MGSSEAWSNIASKLYVILEENAQYYNECVRNLLVRDIATLLMKQFALQLEVC